MNNTKYTNEEIKSLNCVDLNDAILEHLLRYNEKEYAEAEPEVIEQANCNKQVLTKEIIINSVKGIKCTWKMVWGIILLFPAILAFELTIMGVPTGMYILSIIALPIGIFIMKYAVRNIKASKRNKENLLKGNYRIVKTVCSGVTSEDVIDGDGDVVGQNYRVKFANGEELFGRQIALEGDTFYFVYLEGSNKRDAYFSGVHYQLAPDLKIEE